MGLWPRLVYSFVLRWRYLVVCLKFFLWYNRFMFILTSLKLVKENIVRKPGLYKSEIANPPWTSVVKNFRIFSVWEEAFALYWGNNLQIRKVGCAVLVTGVLVWSNAWTWSRRKEYVRIVAGGVLWFLPTPMGKRREFMYVWGNNRLVLVFYFYQLPLT